MKSAWEKLFGNLRLTGSDSAPQMAKLLRATQIAQLQEHRRALLESKRLADPRRLPSFGYRVYSQSDEDGILHEIFKRIGEGTRTFVELGSGDGLENNSLFLITMGWRGLWIDGSPRRVTIARKTLAQAVQEKRLHVEQLIITTSNIETALERSAPARDIDLLSIDLDGNDYHVLDAIQSVRPRVIVAEYNAKFPPDVEWVMEYNEAHRWDGTDYFGASLKSLELLLAGRGYSLVGCSLLGTNAYFVLRDLVNDPPFCSPFTSENHYEPPRYFLLPAFDSGFPNRIGPRKKP